MNKWWMIALIAALIFLPLFIVDKNGGNNASTDSNPAASQEEVFSGADSQAEKMIGKIDPGYKPWFSSFWEPPSGEIESLLFALQAAIGSGIFFYYLGYVKGRKQALSKKEKKNAVN